MIASIVIGAAVFGYAAWTLARFIKKSKMGKCATCELRKSCFSQCEIPSIRNRATTVRR